ncbi:MAG TPA: D-cysteine desulfhydrase family protein [Vicinamibacterales bacterium]|nr:D-cysteine desulfhydrase family protein [Vicinamibacterales bacterium]
MATALASLMAMPMVSLAPHATPIDEMTRLAAALGPSSPRLFVKRDDLLSFGCGGNKVRKIQTVVAEARAAGADSLITCGGVQSNHCRVTAAAGAALGMKVVLVVNGQAPSNPTANAKLDHLFGADVRHVGGRDERAPAMEQAATDLRAAGLRPFIVPLGASTATGALGFARGIAEVAASGIRPDVIVHSTSSGGTQAGLIAGCALFGLAARVAGVSADDSSASLSATVRELLGAMADRLGARPETIGAGREIEVDDTQVGEGYGIPTPASTEAMELAARREGMLLDPVYTAKAMAGLIAGVRTGRFTSGQTVLFWHTGGQVGYFA